MPLLRGYYKNERGRIAWRWYDSVADFHPDTYDSPDKVPDVKPEPPQPLAPVAVDLEGDPIAAEVHGHVRRRGGWPKGVSRSAMARR